VIEGFFIVCSACGFFFCVFFYGELSLFDGFLSFCSSHGVCSCDDVFFVQPLGPDIPPFFQGQSVCTLFFFSIVLLFAV